MNSSLASLITFFEVLGLNQSLLHHKIKQVVHCPYFNLVALFRQFDTYRTGSFGFHDLCAFLQKHCVSAAPQQLACIFQTISGGKHRVYLPDLQRFLGARGDNLMREGKYMQQLDDSVVMLFEQMISNYRRIENQKNKLYGGQATLFGLIDQQDYNYSSSPVSASKNNKSDNKNAKNSQESTTSFVKFLNSYFQKNPQSINNIVEALKGDTSLTFEKFCHLIRPSSTQSYFLEACEESQRRKEDRAINVTQLNLHSRLEYRKHDLQKLQKQSILLPRNYAFCMPERRLLANYSHNFSDPLVSLEAGIHNKLSSDFRSTFNTSATTETGQSQKVCTAPIYINGQQFQKENLPRNKSAIDHYEPIRITHKFSFGEANGIIEENSSQMEPKMTQSPSIYLKNESTLTRNGSIPRREYIESAVSQLCEFQNRVKEARQRSKARKKQLASSQNHAEFIRRISSQNVLMNKTQSDNSQHSNKRPEFPHPRHLQEPHIAQRRSPVQKISVDMVSQVQAQPARYPSKDVMHRIENLRYQTQEEQEADEWLSSNMRENKSSFTAYGYASPGMKNNSSLNNASSPDAEKSLKRCTSGVTLMRPPEMSLAPKRFHSPQSSPKELQVKIQEQLRRSKDELKGLKLLLHKLESQKENRSSTSSNFVPSHKEKSESKLSCYNIKRSAGSSYSNKLSSGSSMVKVESPTWQRIGKSESTQCIDVLGDNQMQRKKPRG